MGVITSISYVKAPDNQWSKDGFPLEIDVTVQIKDLYPVMMASSDYGWLASNTGLAYYLDNLAGLKVTDLYLGTQLKLIMLSKLGRLLNLDVSIDNAWAQFWTAWTMRNGSKTSLQAMMQNLL
jgi:hypothetical protein